MELVSDRARKTPARREARRLINSMKEQGVLISVIGVHDNVLKMRPPICFGREHAELLLSNLEEALDRLSREK